MNKAPDVVIKLRWTPIFCFKLEKVPKSVRKANRAKSGKKHALKLKYEPPKKHALNIWIMRARKLNYSQISLAISGSPPSSGGCLFTF